MKFIKAVASAVGLLAFCHGIQTAFEHTYVLVARLLIANGVIAGVSQSQLHLLVIWRELLVIPALVLFYKLRHKSAHKELYYTRCKIEAPLLGAAIGFTACVAVTLLFIFVPFPTMWQTDYAEKSSDMMSQGSEWYMTVITIIIAPLTEEFVFRGLLYGRLRRGMPPALAAVISAAVFGLAHGSIIWMIYAFLLGLVLAFLFEQTQSLWPSTVAHMVFNIFGQISVFRPWVPPLVMMGVYLVSPLVLAWLMMVYARVTRKPAPMRNE